jgi:hypothetical protein
MYKVKLKSFKDSPRHGRTLKITTFKITGKPPHVLAFTEEKNKSQDNTHEEER